LAELRPAGGRGHRHRCVGFRPPLPDHPHGAFRRAVAGRDPPAQRLRVRSGRIRRGRRHHHADARRAGPPIRAQPPSRRRGRGVLRRRTLMEAVIAIAIGVLFGSGIWLILRPRTFQVIIGLLLMSYAVNRFPFAMGRLWIDAPPITLEPGLDPSVIADPLPQALVLTAIVIGFATTALFLVVMIGSRGLTGTDHIDGEEPDQ